LLKHELPLGWLKLNKGWEFVPRELQSSIQNRFTEPQSLSPLRESYDLWLSTWVIKVKDNRTPYGFREQLSQIALMHNYDLEFRVGALDRLGCEFALYSHLVEANFTIIKRENTELFLPLSRFKVEK
jgi:hypothetical protein